ncbi:MAG: hypothetical protein HY300_20520 [Verrucomicrobia bacterium]|nr:hypothetical protein [Verrucomicrobiota bacterium]
MNVSSKDSVEHQPDVLRETPPDYGFVLPVEPGYRERPPKGSWEAGYRLSLAGLELVKDRPELFIQRDLLMCNVEFKA